MPNDEFDMDDIGLKSIMGVHFTDATKDSQEEELTQTSYTPAAKKTAQKSTQKHAEEKKVDAEWHPVKPHTFIDSLWECVKWAAVFGGLNMLVFYWQLNGLMAESIAVPSMWVCCALAGYGVGLNIWRAR